MTVQKDDDEYDDLTDLNTPLEWSMGHGFGS